MSAALFSDDDPLLAEQPAEDGPWVIICSGGKTLSRYGGFLVYAKEANATSGPARGMLVRAYATKASAERNLPVVAAACSGWWSSYTPHIVRWSDIQSRWRGLTLVFEAEHANPKAVTP